ncbi:flagellar assembly protein FliH [Salicibibacter cibarius]|uniref:Flagellar assembly protein FliH n=1 Tax=Salicibibacter cibarius TaxID=2743000 RepID=A0A7T7CBW3_9BACI|nr:flagellar assembly protein FliH [Salicibibacter cibarius]QQK76379.1 flagellar assembly protein FliH [Salicibibacter cibarius]
MSNIIKADTSSLKANDPHAVLLQPIRERNGQNLAADADEASEGSKGGKKQKVLAKAHEEAETIIAKAKSEKEYMEKEMEKARADLDETIEKAYNDAKSKGEEQGLQAGKEQGYETYQTIIAEAKNIVTAAHEDYRQYMDGAEPTIIDLAVKLAEKILGEKLEMENHWSQFVRQALREVKDQSEVDIFVHPDRYGETVQQREEWQALLSHTERIRFFPDEDLDKNGCLIETPYGRLVASLDDQLEVLQTELHELLAGERGP